MLDNLGIFLCLIGLLVGGVLLQEGTNALDVNRDMKVIGGAALVSLSVTTLWLVMRNKWKWRRHYKKYREG